MLDSAIDGTRKRDDVDDDTYKKRRFVYKQNIGKFEKNDVAEPNMITHAALPPMHQTTLFDNIVRVIGASASGRCSQLENQVFLIVP